MTWQHDLETIAAVALAMLLGGLVGAERELADKPAGFRTHMLVAGAAALFVGLTEAVVETTGVDARLIRADPIRIVEAIITGISFIGAGTIFRHSGRGAHVEGLTTAASLLISAAVGLAAALQQFIVAVGVTVLALIVLRAMKLLARGLRLRDGRD